MSDYDLPPEDTGGSNRSLILVLAVCAITVAVGLSVLGLVDSITANRAVAAQQATLQERERTVQAQQATEQSRIREDARTERWQSFLVAINAARADISLLIPAVGMCLLVVVIWLMDRKRPT